MFVPIALVGLGFAIANRNRPKTVVKKMRALGSKSGLEYEVERLPEANCAVIRLPRAAQMCLRRKGHQWFYLSGKGSERALRAMIEDFGVQFEEGTAPPVGMM